MIEFESDHSEQQRAERKPTLPSLRLLLGALDLNVHILRYERAQPGIYDYEDDYDYGDEDEFYSTMLESTSPGVETPEPREYQYIGKLESALSNPGYSKDEPGSVLYWLRLRGFSDLIPLTQGDEIFVRGYRDTNPSLEERTLWPNDSRISLLPEPRSK